MTTIINNTTKKAQGFIDSYMRSQMCDIYQAYAKPSAEKVAAFRRIEIKASSAGNVGLVYILSASYQTFSCAYEGIYEGKQGLFVETWANTYFIPW